MEDVVLSVKGLNKSFGKRRVLSDINFDCQKGHIVGLIGANGAGKTTIMKSILSLIKSEGQITVVGQPLKFDNHAALQNVGALIEYPGIYPFLSGRNHLKLFVHEGANKQQKIANIIEELKLTKYVDERAKGYSLGMKQKLGIAMALINDPKLVILDEPMNGLDPQATKDLRELILKKKQEGITFLISSHILGELQKLAEDLIIIKDGQIMQKTTMEQLLASNKHYLILSTNDDERAALLLKNNNYQVEPNLPLKVVLRPKDEVESVMKLLSSNGFMVLDLKHEDADLEESFLNLISK